MDFNNTENVNENKNDENDKKNYSSDELIDEIDNKSKKNKMDDEIIKNSIENHDVNEENNINEVNNKVNEDIYKNSDINDFSNPFKGFQNDNVENENNENYNLDTNFNNENKEFYNDKTDNDFINPFKDYKFDEQKDNNSNPYNINNNNINKNIYEENINPYLNNNYQNEDDEFSNPFKNDDDYNESNKNFNNEYNRNNNNYGLFRNINNNNQNNFNNKINYNINNEYITNSNQPNNNIKNNKYNNNNFNNKNNNNIFQNLSNNQNRQFNSDNNNFYKINEIKNENYSREFELMESIIKKCESLYFSAKSNYENYKIRESIATLKKIISTLLSLKLKINQKTELSPFFPQVNMLEIIVTTTLYDYRINIYEGIDRKFKSLNSNQYKKNESLQDFCSKFILNNSFISFDDIYDNNNLIDYFMEKLKDARIHQKKCILLYGDRGSGKTLLVHGCANKMGATVAQIEGEQFLKIPFFAKEFVKVCFKSIGINKPLFVYMKNIEYMFSCKNQFDFIYDKVASSFDLNVYFIASTNINLKNLPKEIYNKFQFFHEVKTIEKKNKADFMRFLCEKFEIKLNLNILEMNNFVNQNLYNFPNRKIFELLKCAINIKKQKTIQTDQPNWVYKEGLNLNDLTDAVSQINPFL